MILSIALTPVINLFIPIQHLLLPLCWLVVLDIISGIYKARVIQGKPITSRRFFERKAGVLLVWSLGVLTMLFADTFLLEINIKGNWAAKLYCVFYAMYEVISILENLAESGLPGAKGILMLLRGKLPTNLNTALDAEKESKDEDKSE